MRGVVGAIEGRNGRVPVRKAREDVDVDRTGALPQCDLEQPHVEGSVQLEIPLQRGQNRRHRLNRPHLAAWSDRGRHHEREPPQVRPDVHGEIAGAQELPDRRALTGLELAPREDLRVRARVGREVERAPVRIPKDEGREPRGATSLGVARSKAARTGRGPRAKSRRRRRSCGESGRPSGRETRGARPLRWVSVEPSRTSVSRPEAPGPELLGRRALRGRPRGGARGHARVLRPDRAAPR